MVHLVIALVLLIATTSCKSAQESAKEDPQKPAPEKTELVKLEVRSIAFEHDSLIPREYTCDGEDISPALTWSGVPDGVKSLALICDDPDAPSGVWVHWVLYGIPPDTESLPAAVPGENEVLGGMLHGTTSVGRAGYGGPCPPKGKPHRYFFKLYAMDAELELEPGRTKEELLAAMEGHVVARGELMGRYGR